jgi:hypothetical protein
MSSPKISWKLNEILAKQTQKFSIYPNPTNFWLENEQKFHQAANCWKMFRVLRKNKLKKSNLQLLKQDFYIFHFGPPRPTTFILWMHSPTFALLIPSQGYSYIGLFVQRAKGYWPKRPTDPEPHVSPPSWAPAVSSPTVHTWLITRHAVSRNWTACRHLAEFSRSWTAYHKAEATRGWQHEAMRLRSTGA